MIKTGNLNTYLVCVVSQQPSYDYKSICVTVTKSLHIYGVILEPTRLLDTIQTTFFRPLKLLLTEKRE